VIRSDKLAVRAADEVAKAQREMIEREKRETELADKWVRENGGWAETYLVDENGDRVESTTEVTFERSWSQTSDPGSEED